MKFFYSPETRQAETFADVKEATVFLTDEVIPRADATRVSAEWTRVLTPREETFDRLTLRDENGEVFADFTASELRIPRYIRASLFHLWADLQLLELQKLRRENSRLMQELIGTTEGN